jgi:hypothetical protein
MVSRTGPSPIVRKPELQRLMFGNFVDSALAREGPRKLVWPATRVNIVFVFYKHPKRG